MPWYLYIALRQLFPQDKRLPFFTLMSLIGVSLGTMVLVVVISVFNGFGHQLRSIISDTQGDLKLMNGRAFADYDAIAEKLLADPRVVGVSPSAWGYVMLQIGNRPVFPAVQGIDVAAEREVVPIDRYIYRGALDDLDDDSVVLSSGIANTLGIGVGDVVDVYTPLMLEKLKRDEVLLPRAMRVAALFESGFSKIDENTILVTLRAMQDLYGLGESVHALKMKLQPGLDDDEVAADLQTQFKAPFRVSTWMESNADYLAIIAFEKRMMFFLLLLIVIVGSFSIATSLFTSVVRKMREIGLFAAMGATSGQIAACFCMQGFAVGVSGTLLGFAMGFGILGIRESITDFLFWLIGSKQHAMEFYFFNRLPVHVEPSDIATIGVFTIVIATLASLVPAYKAARLKPVEALRSE